MRARQGTGHGLERTLRHDAGGVVERGGAVKGAQACDKG